MFLVSGGGGIFAEVPWGGWSNDSGVIDRERQFSAFSLAIFRIAEMRPGYIDTRFVVGFSVIPQESLADAKVSARQQCVYELAHSEEIYSKFPIDG